MEQDSALVFEDDVVLAKDLKIRLDALKLPDDWAICYLGCLFRETPEFVRPGLLRAGATFDMHAYIIRKSFAKILGPALRQPSQRRLEGNVLPEARTAIDVILSDHHKHHAAYAVWPPMAWQVEGLSNIEHAFRGNYHPDGRQRIYEEAIANLPWEPSAGSKPDLGVVQTGPRVTLPVGCVEKWPDQTGGCAQPREEMQR